MQRVCVWVVVLVVVAVVGVQGLSEWGKPFTEDQVIPSLETALQQLAQCAQNTPHQAQKLASELGVFYKEDHVRVVVETDDFLSANKINRLGGEVLARADAFNLLEVDIPTVGLLELARLPGVSFVRRAYHPVPFVVSEGVQATGAQAWQQAGYLGQGVRVAVIDAEFGGLSQALTAGEIDHVIFRHDYTGEGLETGGVHGTACAEIVHDMAPQAELLLMKIGNEVQLSNAVEDAIAYGANLITCSLGWFNTNFYDGTGIVPDIVSHAVQNEILWVNAAGNSANGGHWEGDWQDADMDEWLDFAPWDEENNFHLSGGQSVILWLTWDAWPATHQDYDLYLVDGRGSIVASSENWQTDTQEPTEMISFRAPAAGNYGIKIEAYDAPAHPRMELFCSPYALPLEYNVAASSICAPANAPFVLTVGAIDWQDWETGPQEAFSSQGPTNSSRHAVSITKPDICGPDGVSGLSYEAFYGTSASCPHAAGAAALVWSVHPSWSLDNVRDWLESNAIDMGPWGKDNLYGHGRLHMPLTDGSELCTLLRSDWNLISLPVDPDNSDPQAVFDEIIGPLYLCTYDSGAESFDWVDKPPSATAGTAGRLTKVGPFGGYWVAVPENTDICVDGTLLSGDQTIELETSGWHMIGTPYPVAWGDGNGGMITITQEGQTLSLRSAVAAGWIYGTIWMWNADAKAWTKTTVHAGTTLDPWMGYWINTSVDDLALNFSETPGLQGLPSGLLPMDGAPMTDPPIPWNPSLELPSLRVVNEPNPVMDGHSTMFRVLGICPCSVRGLRVEVYDLAGYLVWEGDTAASYLPWNTLSTFGVPLPNGVYLYRAAARIRDEWVTMPVGKLAILQ